MSGVSSLYLAGSRRLFPGEVSHSLFNVIKKRTYVDSQNDILQNLCKSVFGGGTLTSTYLVVIRAYFHAF